MSKSKVMVIASALILVASGGWSDRSDQMGHLLWLIGSVLPVIFGTCLMKEKG